MVFGCVRRLERRLCHGMTESDKSAVIETLHRIRRSLSEP